MNVNEFNVRKTGLLFFDMLNVYYHGATPEKKESMRPVVNNAARLLEAARKVSIPVFYAMANHRRDGMIRSRIICTSPCLPQASNPKPPSLQEIYIANFND